MPQAKWTTQANFDLEEIVFYIGVEKNRRSTARKIAHDLREKCEAYAASPLIGTACPNLGESFRLFPFKRWVVIYRSIENSIEILRIVDGSRDYPSLFG